MALNRLFPSLRAPIRAFPRQFHTSRLVQNSPVDTKTTEEIPQIDQTPVEITESHRRDVKYQDQESRRKPMRAKGSKSSTQNQNQDESADFFHDPSSSQTGTARSSKSLETVDTDLLSSSEFTETSKAQRSKSNSRTKSTGGPGENRDRREGQGQARGPRRDGRPSGPRDASASGPSGQRSDRPGGQGRTPRPRDGPPRDRDRAAGDRGKIVAPISSQSRSQPVMSFDKSYTGLFGAASLISPPRRGAREVGDSFWAKDLEAGEARKTDLMRLAGSYSLRLPTTPHPSTLAAKTSAAEKAKAMARWTIAVNPTVPLRARDPGVGVVDRLLR